MVVLDTNVVIDHLRLKEKNKTSLLDLLNEEFILDEEVAISVITVQELYEGTSTRVNAREELMLSTLNSLVIFNYDFDIAKVAGKILRDSNVAIEFQDAAIAATSILKEAELFTLNNKHFVGIEGLEMFDIRRLKRITNE